MNEQVNDQVNDRVVIIVSYGHLPGHHVLVPVVSEVTSRSGHSPRVGALALTALPRTSLLQNGEQIASSRWVSRDTGGPMNTLSRTMTFITWRPSMADIRLGSPPAMAAPLYRLLQQRQRAVIPLNIRTFVGGRGPKGARIHRGFAGGHYDHLSMSVHHVFNRVKETDKPN